MFLLLFVSRWDSMPFKGFVSILWLIFKRRSSFKEESFRGTHSWVQMLLTSSATKDGANWEKAWLITSLSEAPHGTQQKVFVSTVKSYVLYIHSNILCLLYDISKPTVMIQFPLLLLLSLKVWTEISFLVMSCDIAVSWLSCKPLTVY